MVKKIFLAIVIVVLSLSLWLYFNFCRFNQIGIDTNTNPKTWHDTIVHIQDVIANYPKTMFLYKGCKFDKLPCREYRNINNQHIVNIKFNWNNTITCSIDNQQFHIKVDSINIATCCYMLFDTITMKHGSEDSMFYSISFYDKKKNCIEVSRQKGNLPYGGKRNGFYLDIENLHIGTGKANTSPFDY